MNGPLLALTVMLAGVVWEPGAGGQLLSGKLGTAAEPGSVFARSFDGDLAGVPAGAQGAGPAAYVTARRYDLVGNKVRETDGNGHATSWKLDFENRVVLTTDAAGREQSQAFDAQGNLVGEATRQAERSGTPGRRRTTAWGASAW